MYNGRWAAGRGAQEAAGEIHVSRGRSRSWEAEGRVAANALSSVRSPVRWGVGLLLGSALAQLISGALWMHEAGSHIVWIPGAVLLSALLVAPLGTWYACVAGMVAGVVVVAGVFGLSMVDVGYVLLPVAFAAPLAAWLLLKIPGDLPPLEDFRKLAGFCAIAVIGLPVVCAPFIVWISWHTSLAGDVLGDWRNIALAHALGYALYTPVWVSLLCPDSAFRRVVEWSPPMLIGFVLALGALWILWFSLGSDQALRPLLLLAPVPIVIWISTQLQMAGAALSIAIIAILAAKLSINGLGPFAGDTPQLTTLSVQLWSLAIAIGGMCACMLIEQRVAIRRTLAESNRHVRELAGRLIATQEHERARLARDLHDDINQRLAAASIQLSALRRNVEEERRNEVGHIQSQLVSLSDDVRQLSHELHPSMLRQTGLAAALESLCVAQRHAHGPKIVLDVVDQADGLPEDVALCYYRVVQEALSNTLRHARARHVRVAVDVLPGHADLIVADDGVGFSHTESRDGSRGLGLISIEERVKLFEGKFQIQTSPGKGTTICARICLPT